MTRRMVGLIGIAMVVAGSAAGQRAVMDDGFERSRGDFVRDLVRHDRLEVVKDEGVGGGKALEATYQGSDRGSERIVVDVELDRPGEAFTLCYDVKFSESFDFARGGKLPGLGPDRPVAGGDPIRPDGWSVRLMWQAEGGLISYIYHQDQAGKYGDGKRADFRFERGKYHAVSIQVQINSDGDTADGRVAVFLDGEQVIEHPEVRLRGVGRKDALISQFLFSSFHGGNSPDWAPRDADGNYSVEKAWFDNVAVFKGQVVRKQAGSGLVGG